MAKYRYNPDSHKVHNIAGRTAQCNFDEMRQRAIAATRQLAKRQYTWLRSWPDLAVLDKANLAEVLKIVEAASI